MSKFENNRIVRKLNYNNFFKNMLLSIFYMLIHPSTRIEFLA